MKIAEYPHHENDNKTSVQLASFYILAGHVWSLENVNSSKCIQIFFFNCYSKNLHGEIKCTSPKSSIRCKVIKSSRRSKISPKFALPVESKATIYKIQK